MKIVPFADEVCAVGHVAVKTDCKDAERSRWRTSATLIELILTRPAGTVAIAGAKSIAGRVGRSI